jgi:hypothetical protein
VNVKEWCATLSSRLLSFSGAVRRAEVDEAGWKLAVAVLDAGFALGRFIGRGEPLKAERVGRHLEGETDEPTR